MSEGLPTEVLSALDELEDDLAEGDITHKGYIKRRTQILEASGFADYLNLQSSLVSSEPSAEIQSLVDRDHDYGTIRPLSHASSDSTGSRHMSSEPRKAGLDHSSHTESINDDRHSDRPYAFRPLEEATSRTVVEPAYDNGEFGTSRLESEDKSQRYLSETLLSDRLIGSPLTPLEPRGLPFAISDPLNPNIAMSSFDNIAAVLRHRGRSNPKKAAFMVLDIKGKELATITWDKLASRAEKVAQVIRDKSGLYRGDRVALLYRECEVVDFAIALFGCFIAGVVAVPVNRQDDFHELTTILAATQAHLALTTDTNLKAFHREMSLQNLSWPRGVEWWKTNEFGSFHPRKREEVPPVQAPDLAYIEYSRSPIGDLRGVVISHRTVMHQMACLSAIISTTPGAEDDVFVPSRDAAGRPYRARNNSEILITYLDPRQAIGMILGVLLALYHGYTTIWCTPATVAIPGLFAQIITRYRASLLLADYPGLKTVAYNYQNDPMSTRGKKHHVDFSSIKLCLVDCLTVDTEFHEILADRWLRPLGNKRSRAILSPMLCLPEHGGMVISMCDHLEGHERLVDSGVTLPKNADDTREVLLDKEALKSNQVLILAASEDARLMNEQTTIRVGSFWYPIADATLAVIDPETSLLCSDQVVGEIWIDSPSMSACYWLLPRHTEAIFHARPSMLDSSGRACMLEQEFLRTGLLGFICQGRIFVLGLYEDRLRQRVEVGETMNNTLQYRYHYIAHLVSTIMRFVPKVFDCSAFDVYVNKEHLPVVLIESPAASTIPLTPSGVDRILDEVVLEAICARLIEVLLSQHQVRVYCVLICAPNTLPRVLRNGRKEIGNMLCRKEFEHGNLPTVFVKFAVERAVTNLPHGPDPVGGIWSTVTSELHERMLHYEEKQFSGLDLRSVVLDDRTSTSLSDFGSIVEILQWRIQRQSDEMALCTIDARGREGKSISWKKLDLKIASVAFLLRNKVRLKASMQVILLYTHSEDLFVAVHACLCLGITAIPLAPFDAARLVEDVPAFLSLVQEYSIKTVLVNSDTHSALSAKTVSQHLKHSAQAMKITLPDFVNTSKPSKQSKGCRDLGYLLEQAWLSCNFPALVWIYWTPDQRRTAVSLNHSAILGHCKTMKETCQMPSSRPVLGCIRSTSGLGFVQSFLCGPYIGCSTYLLSPLDFAANPAVLLQVLSRYKIKDFYATPQTMDHIISAVQPKTNTLHELKNIMICFDSRPGLDDYARLKKRLSSIGLDSSALNATYGQIMCPLTATRSYMCIEPIELMLDSHALREGWIQLTNSDDDPFAVVIQDSGMVPVCTRIAIVHPETKRLCRAGEFGEIWVASEMNAFSFHGSKDIFDRNRFRLELDGTNDSTLYDRTGDLGFLHTIRRAIGGTPGVVEMQSLFVLGNIGETFEINGLNHFPIDIENTVERCHKAIVGNGSAIFQAGEHIVLLVEVLRNNFLSCLAPVIVNAVLSEHQISIDRIVFCAKGDFPRSRLREKQRGRILSAYITKKLKYSKIYDVREMEANTDPAHASASLLTPVLESDVVSGTAL